MYNVKSKCCGVFSVYFFRLYLAVSNSGVTEKCFSYFGLQHYYFHLLVKVKTSL